MQLRILGTSPPLATLRSGQAGTGLLISSGDTFVLVDCGPGVTQRIDRMGINVCAINTILLTHHHWDHVADLPHFVLGRWEASLFGSIGGETFAPPLTIFGPAGTVALIDKMFGETGVFAGDIATRLAPEIGVALYTARGVGLPFPPVLPGVTEIHAGEEWSCGPFQLRAAEANHCQPYLRSLAYRFTLGEATLVFSGDSSPSRGIEELARGADLLLHDCNVRIARDTLRHREIHATPDEVAHTATVAGVNQLVIVHHGLQSDDIDGRQQLAATIRRGYGGRIVIARELDIIEL